MPLTNGIRRGFSSTQNASALLIVAAVCGHLLIALPRTAIPRELPALRCSAAAADKVFANDGALAAKAPTSPVARALDALLLEKGESERHVTESVDTQSWRKKRIDETLVMFRKREGDDGLVQLRAAAVLRLQDALDLKLPPEQVQGVLGSFPTTLRETLVSRDGVIVAHELVVRTLYKVRWNVIMGLPLLFSLESAERHAYSGWFALHGDNGPIPARLNVLDMYAKEGGDYVHEARGMLGYVGGDPSGARRAFERANAARPSYRTRNLIRSAKRAEYTLATKP